MRRVIRDLLARTLDRYIDRRVVVGYGVFGDRSRLSIDPLARVYGAHFNTSSGTIAVERHAFFGPNVAIVTGTHDYTKFGLDRNMSVPDHGYDIVIQEGAWIAAGATVVGPCVVGSHSVVAAGAVVTTDVEPYAVVAGVPARVLRYLDHPRGSKAGGGRAS
jgi:acetyltransferase-like isoleucine patch superfamily enzyme